jgi:hypothetical protein
MKFRHSVKLVANVRACYKMSKFHESSSYCNFRGSYRWAFEDLKVIKGEMKVNYITIVYLPYHMLS